MSELSQAKPKGCSLSVQCAAVTSAIFMNAHLNGVLNIFHRSFGSALCGGVNTKNVALNKIEREKLKLSVSLFKLAFVLINFTQNKNKIYRKKANKRTLKMLFYDLHRSKMNAYFLEGIFNLLEIYCG